MAARAWWRDGVLYQLYPRSFADSDGDGTGDLRGIIDHLDHLAWLGIDGLWLNPTFPSPNADWGFDVADYRDVHPDLGTLADLEDLISAAGERGIRVLLDLVPNHTSDEHPWFVDARGDRDAPHRDWYVWRDPGPGGAPPNNWVSIFGGPAWEPDGATGQSYLHMFHRQAAGPELVERRGPRRVRGDPRLLVRPRRRRLPHRRRARDRQGPRPARQPAGADRTTRRACTVSASASSTR